MALSNQLTLIVKTFLRPKRLQRLIMSCKQYLPGLRIIVADDGKPYANQAKGIPMPAVHKYLELPFDVGLSEGRNQALRHVQTPYTMLFDDDFLLDGCHPVHEALEYIRESRLELLGLRMWRKEHGHHAWERWLDVNGSGEVLTMRKPEADEQVGQHMPCELCLNCFIARTGALQEVQWTPALKMGEHLDFFLRFKGRPMGVYQQGHVLHQRGGRTSPEYKAKRARAAAMRNKALRKMGIMRVVDSA